MPIQRSQSQRKKLVTSVATTSTSLFSYSASDQTDDGVTGSLSISVYNRVKRLNDTASEQWRSMEPFDLAFPASPKEATSKKSPKGSKLKRNPTKTNPAKGAIATQYQNLGMYAAVPPSATVKTPKPITEVEVVRTAYFIKISSSVKSRSGREPPSSYHSVSTKLAEKLSTKSTYFYFIEQMHADNLHKFNLTDPVKPNSPSSPSTKVGEVESIWTPSKISSKYPNMEPPTVHIMLPHGGDFKLLIDWLDNGDKNLLRNGLGLGTRQSGERFANLVADADYLGFQFKFYQVLAAWAVEHFRSAELFRSELLQGLPTHMLEACAARADREASEANSTQERSRLHHLAEMMLGLCHARLAPVNRKTDSIFTNFSRRSVITTLNRKSILRPPTELEMAGLSPDPDYERHLQELEDLFNDFNKQLALDKNIRRNSIDDDVRSLLSKYKVEIGYHSDQDDSGISVTSSPVAGRLSMSDTELETLDYEDPRAGMFFENLSASSKVQDYTPPQEYQAPQNPIDRRESNAGLIAATTEFQKWRTESSLRHFSKPPSPNSPSTPISPAMSRTKSTSKSRSPISSPLSPGAGAGAFMGHDDSSDEDERPGNRIFLTRQFSGSTPFRSGSSSPFKSSHQTVEVGMTSVVVVRDCFGGIVCTAIYAWRSDDCF
ncbi:hypothetical protein HDU97_007209 [Phlyctochytrium planicorne]|nr:hypothetical protein HDU97_007209 [Phlyctochytrium planicorne]